LRFNSFLVSLPIFSSLPLAVNPVGVTTYWCYFSRIIVYNLVTIYGIATKFGIRMHPYRCTKFQGNPIMPLCFIATFTPWRKEEKKQRDSANFWRFISQTYGTPNATKIRQIFIWHLYFSIDKIDYIDIFTLIWSMFLNRFH